MKISKFLAIAIVSTCLSLLYVWQQTEIFRLAYLGQKKEVTHQDLLDKNSILRYNVKRNASLVYIANAVSKEADFQMPESFRLVRAVAPSKILVSESLPKKQNLLSRLFGVRRQAEAKTINPSTALGAKQSRTNP